MKKTAPGNVGRLKYHALHAEIVAWIKSSRCRTH
jgi:hypothetical protein